MIATSIQEILDTLNEKSITPVIEDGELYLESEKGSLPPDIISLVRKHKQAIIRTLNEQEEWFKDKHPFHREFYDAGYSFEYVKACWDAWQQIERIELKPEGGG